MQKKRLVFAFFLIFPLIVGLACNFTGKDPEPTQTPVVITAPATEEPAEVVTKAATEEETAPVVTGEFQDLMMLDNGVWFQDGASVFASFFFRNPNGDLVFEDVGYSVYLYDANGDEIGNDYSNVHWIFPGQTFGIVFNLYLDDENALVDSVNVDWEYDSTFAADGFTNPFTTSNLVYWQNGDYPIVTGIINNTDPETYTDIRTNIICYNSAGEIVGGGYTYIDFVPGSDYMGFSTYVDAYDSVASVEVFPTFTYSSLQYEGNDFWSEISVLEDYFYSTTYGSLLGGFVIQSNIDTVLSDSVAVVNFYDKDGNITSTGEYYIDLLLPHQTLGISPWAMTPPDDATTDSYDVLVLPGDYESDYELTENPFVVNSAILTGDYNDQVTVNFTNTYSKQASEVDVYVLLYDAEGNIIGGGNDWTTEPIPAGSTMDFELWVDYSDSKEVASIEAWVVPSYWTEFE
ncbi:MAG: hypothetical protein H0S79_04330 [Anaerolineaceae bacterium]|nr:hypothetical protein [Anaerolineaceae bacterium]